MRGEQLSRQWRILRIIEASTTGMTIAEIADLEDINIRTLYRDLEALQAAGFPLYCEKVEGANRWAFVDSFRFRLPQPFTQTELMALHMYADLARVFKGTPFYDSLDSLFRKVRATLPPQTLDYLGRMQSLFHVGIKPYSEYGRFREFISRIHQAAMDKRCVDIVYRSLRSPEETHRRVEPYKIWFYEGTIYLIGFCRLRNEMRMFVVDRVKMLTVTDDRFLIPEDFDLDTYMKHSFKVMRDETHTVVIRISPGWARYIGEKIWHESQRMERRRDGSLVLTVHVAGLDEIKRWVLSLGKEARVLAPEALIDAVRRELRLVAELYEDQEKPRISVQRRDRHPPLNPS